MRQQDIDDTGRHAKELGAPTPMLSATLPIHASAMAQGRAGQDTASVCAVPERMAGISRAG